MLTDLSRRAFEARTADPHPKVYFQQYHLRLLNEWNEEALFESTSTTVITDETGTTTVTGCLWHSVVKFKDGEFEGYEHRQLDGQFIAVYGDDEKLCFLGILTNPGIEVLVDHPIRS